MSRLREGRGSGIVASAAMVAVRALGELRSVALRVGSARTVELGSARERSADVDQERVDALVPLRESGVSCGDVHVRVYLVDGRYELRVHRLDERERAALRGAHAPAEVVIPATDGSEWVCERSRGYGKPLSRHR